MSDQLPRLATVASSSQLAETASSSQPREVRLLDLSDDERAAAFRRVGYLEYCRRWREEQRELVRPSERVAADQHVDGRQDRRHQHDQQSLDDRAATHRPIVADVPIPGNPRASRHGSADLCTPSRKDR